MKDEAEKSWEEFQMTNWKNSEEEIVSLFRRFDLDISGLWQHIMVSDYDRAQTVAYLLLGKITIAIEICNFLDTLAQKDNRDVDVIKIYILISHAEIASRSFGNKGQGAELVRKFFEPVKSELRYRIKPTISTASKNKYMDFAYILYKIRCEYTHEGNYTGNIFIRGGEGQDPLLIFFKDAHSILSAECGIRYEEFLKIYMKALIENVKTFSKYSEK